VQTGIATVSSSAPAPRHHLKTPTRAHDSHEFFARLVPEDQDYFIHTAEGSDDMPSHLRMVLTRTGEVIPIAQGRMTLGTWQGIFLFEHRRAPHSRTIAVNVIGL
jgi:secondary thiamine-phosphate synthase enzyme